MANGTRNVFITQTKNPFLPYIQAFTDYMGQYMQQQGALAEKMYAFNKKRQGEEFVNVFGSKIREAKDLSGLSKAMGEAITTGYAKGLEQTLPTLKAIGDVQSSLIGEETLKKQATEYEDFILGQYGKQKFSWEGKAVTGEEIVGILRNKFTDPVARYTVLKNDLPQLGIVEQQGVVMKGNQAFLTTGGVDKFGNVFGNESYKIIPTDKGVFYDVDKSGGYTPEDKSLPPSMAEKYSNLIEDKQRFNRQMSEYEKPKFIGTDASGKIYYYDTKGAFTPEYKNGKPTGNKIYTEKIGDVQKVGTRHTNVKTPTVGQMTRTEKAYFTGSGRSNLVAWISDKGLGEYDRTKDPTSGEDLGETTGGGQKVWKYEEFPESELLTFIDNFTEQIKDKPISELSDDEKETLKRIEAWKADNILYNINQQNFIQGAPLVPELTDSSGIGGMPNLNATKRKGSGG